MSEQSDAPTAADALPPGFYERVAPFLQLCGMGCLQFFSRPHDPLPQEITDLTGLDLAGTRMITAINSNDMLARQLLEEPELFYVYLLVGCLVLDGPLAVPVLRFLEQSMQLDAEQTDAIRAHLLPFGETFVELVGRFAAHDDEEAQEDLHLLRLQIEGAFARLADTLQTTELPDNAPAAPADAEEEDDWDEDAEDDEADEDDEPIFEIRFREEQLHMLRLAVTLARVLPTISELPFAQAVAQLSGCTPAAIVSLNARLREADDTAPTQMSWHDVALLYQSTQVLAMALVSNVLDVLRWEEHLSEEPPAEAPAAPADTAADDPEAALTPAERFVRRQEIICMMITGFVECVQEHFADEPRLDELRQEMTDLADLL
ncbi:hypothetical protein [Hymenobacter jeollabukensis]|uniref:Uncharacterized protein n=1 Tax=Hymenobacter jeollabukensis TaxID=2025313 RepID=A0A5R8WMG4_9BACT|nr:hypothetical protein [Hymenobacter jeollabukensis]TLM90616.1 hypothetical protein FDY95_18085 [Hymenobacter jeollabukensis]